MRELLILQYEKSYFSQLIAVQEKCEKSEKFEKCDNYRTCLITSDHQNFEVYLRSIQVTGALIMTSMEYMENKFGLMLKSNPGPHGPESSALTIRPKH